MKILLILLSLPTLLIGQNLEKINKKDAIKINGNIQFNTSYNSSYDNQYNRNPLTWNLAAKINLQVLDFSLPFTFTYSNLGTRFTQPFNITTISPKYKWFQAHIGLTSMNISPYTISGRIFLGTGIELNFKKWKIKSLFGRLTKAIEYSPEQNNLNQIAYKRLGGAFSIEYSNKGQQFSLAFFKAKDMENSLNFVPLNSEITPKDNFVIDVNLSNKLFKILTLKINYALSLLTKNTRIETVGYNSNTFDFLFKKNISSSINHMIDAELKVQLKNFNIGFNYHRISPDFYTLGSYYMNNNLERYSIIIGVKTFKNKLNIRGSFGYQRNNIFQESKSKTNRFTTNINISSILSKKMILTIQYNNFNSYTIGKDQSDPFYNTQFDSLKLFQVNQTANLNYSVRLGTKSQPQLLNLLFNFVQNRQDQGNFNHPGFFGLNTQLNSNPNNVISTIISHSFSLKQKNTSFQTSVNYNINFRDSIQNHFIGPSFNYNQKIFNKKASLNLGITYNFNKSTSLIQNIMNYKFAFTYSPEFWDKKYGKFNFSFNGSYLQRFGRVQKFTQQFSLFFGMGYGI